MATKMIAYRDSDIDNDVWCESSFLFKTNEDVKAFFVSDNPTLLDVYTEEDDRVLYDFAIHESPVGNIERVSFRTNYAGEKSLYQMDAGYLIEALGAMLLDPTAGTHGRVESERPPIRTKSTEAERMRRKGLKPFDIDGKTVWATNLKNAKRKAHGH